MGLNFQYSYLSEQFTDVQNSLRAAPGDAKSGLVGEIPAYGVADMTMSWTHKSMFVEAGVNNLLNTNYFTRRATGYPGPGIIPSDGRSLFLTIGYRVW